jgi:hypothetical protein
MTILSTQERKYETKTFNENFAKKVRTCRLPFPVTRSLNSLLLTTITKSLYERTGTAGGWGNGVGINGGGMRRFPHTLKFHICRG